MTMMCPKCRDLPLIAPPGRATRLRRCGSCKGTWLPRDEARLEAVNEILAADDTLKPGSEHDAKTGLCPEGHGILIRAKVELEEPFYIERCAECVGIWFDQGEWNKLAQTHLIENLDQIWDPAWRFKHRQSKQQTAQVGKLSKELGQESFEALNKLVETLRSKPSHIRTATLAHLRDLVDTGLNARTSTEVESRTA